MRGFIFGKRLRNMSGINNLISAKLFQVQKLIKGGSLNREYQDWLPSGTPLGLSSFVDLK